MANPFLQASAGPGALEGGVRRYLLGVYSYMAGGLVLTGIAAYYGAASGLYQSIVGTPWFWLVLLAPLALVLLLSFRIDRMSLLVAQLTFWGYAVLVGLSISGIFLVYTGESIARTFLISGGAFAGTSLYGYMTRADLSRFGSFLFMGLIGIVLAALVNFFLRSSALQLTISVIGVFVFVGLTAYDTQRIKRIFVEGDASDAGKKSILGALALYLDFLNLFLLLLQLTGNRRQ